VIGENCFKSCKPTIWSCTCSLVTQVFVCTHPAEPPPDRPTASRCPPTTEASAAPASPTLFRRRTDPYETVVFKRETTIGLISQKQSCVSLCAGLMLTWWRLDRIQAGVDASVVAAAFMALALWVRAAARHLTGSLRQHLGWRWTPVVLLVLRGLGVVGVLVVLEGRERDACPINS